MLHEDHMLKIKIYLEKLYYYKIPILQLSPFSLYSIYKNFYVIIVIKQKKSFPIAL